MTKPNWYVAIMLSTLGILLGPRESQAILVKVEPDEFPISRELTNAVPGVTLSVAKTTGEPTSTAINKVEVLGNPTVPPVMASTGVFAFGRQVGRFAPDQAWFQSGLDFVPGVFRADFVASTDFVSIDIIRTGAAATGRLQAFDALDNLLDTFTANLGEVGTFVAASITRPTADIAYILAGGFPSGGPPFNPVGLDNLQFNGTAVPEPGRFILMSLALAWLGFMHRRRKITAG